MGNGKQAGGHIVGRIAVKQTHRTGVAACPDSEVRGSGHPQEILFKRDAAPPLPPN